MVLRVTMVGALGRMGQAIIRLIRESSELKLVGAIEGKSSSNIGKEIDSIEISSNLLDVSEQTDVYIDFTNAKALQDNIDSYKEANKPLLIGTTGLDENAISMLKEELKMIPILLSSNTSMGVNSTLKLLAEATKMLENDYEIEIIESHHNNKIDAPSGTAITMAKTICEASKFHNFEEDCIYERHSMNKKRSFKDIGIQSLRGGNIIGEHEVHFIGKNDTISITHKAQSRDLFASGALKLIKWLSGKPAGFYEMKDVIKY